MSDENFLSRWSRRKSAAKVAPAGPTADAAPAQVGTQSPAAPSSDVVPAKAETRAPEPLPPVESLTIDSDFSAFMKPGVDPALRRQALKTLLHDPRFNVMDGLDVYIGDYSQPDPLPEGWLEKMNQVKHLGIFSEPAEAVEPVPDTLPEPTEKAPEEQPVESAPPALGSDTSSAQISPSQVGKSTPPRGGDPDVLV